MINFSKVSYTLFEQYFHHKLHLSTSGALPEGRKQEVYFKVCQDSTEMPPLDSDSGECYTFFIEDAAIKSRSELGRRVLYFVA